MWKFFNYFVVCGSVLIVSLLGVGTYFNIRNLKNREAQVTHEAPAGYHREPGVPQYVSDDGPKFSKRKPPSRLSLGKELNGKIFYACETDDNCIEWVSHCIAKAFAKEINEECEGKSVYCGFNSAAFAWDDYLLGCAKKWRKK